MHRSGAKSTLCNVAIKLSPLSLHIFIHSCHFCFAVTWCPSTTLICSSVFFYRSEVKSETCGVRWHVALESKIQLVNCELSPTLLLGHSSLSDIGAIDAYIFWSLLFLLMSHFFCDEWLPFSLECSLFCCF